MRKLITFCVVTLLLSLVALMLDHSMNSLSTWIKPAKFALSILLYAVSLQFIQRFINSQHAILPTVVQASLVGGFIELISTLTQSVLISSGLSNQVSDGILLIVGRLAIMPLALLDLLMLVLLMKEENLPPLLGSALKWGLVLTAVGFIPGLLLIAPEPVQACLSSNTFCSGGNLRIAHFTGIHALQVLPLLAIYLERFDGKLSQNEQLNILRISGFSYFALIQILTWQALCDEMVLFPGTQTKQIFEIWLLATSVAISSSILWSKLLSRCWKQVTNEGSCYIG